MENATYSKGDILKLKSGSPNLLCVKDEGDSVRIAYWNENEKKMEYADIMRDLLETQEAHGEREKDWQCKMNTGYIRLPPGVNEDGLVVVAFPDAQTAQQFANEHLQGLNDPFNMVHGPDQGGHGLN